MERRRLNAPFPAFLCLRYPISLDLFYQISLLILGKSRPKISKMSKTFLCVQKLTFNQSKPNSRSKNRFAVCKIVGPLKFAQRRNRFLENTHFTC